jgi:hypothetical protein
MQGIGRVPGALGLPRAWLAMSVWLVLALAGAGPAHVQAQLPAAYGAITVHARATDNPPRLDLRAAIEQARRSGKPILLYFAADDCPACKVLERRFAEHATQLAPAISQHYILIEARAWLRSPRPLVVLPQAEYDLGSLNARFGLPQRGSRFVWPSFYALDPDTLRSVREIDEGNSRLLELDEAQIELGL